jgi:hypothetical protein
VYDNCIQNLDAKLEVTMLLGRPGYIWEYNIKMDLWKIGCRSIDWINLAQDKDKWHVLLNMVTKFWFLQNTGNFLTNLSKLGPQEDLCCMELRVHMFGTADPPSLLLFCRYQGLCPVR